MIPPGVVLLLAIVALVSVAGFAADAWDRAGR